MHIANDIKSLTLGSTLGQFQDVGKCDVVKKEMIK